MSKEVLAYAVRIALRYIAGMLIAKGLIDASTINEITSDPQLIDYLATGLHLVGGVVVGWIAEKLTEIARRLGWHR